MNTSYRPIAKESMFCLDQAASGRLWQELRDKAFDPYAERGQLERFLLEAATILRVLPPELVVALVAFRTYGSADEAFVVRGLLPEAADYGPTPEHWSLVAQRKPSFESELCRAALTTLLGDLFSFSSEHEGNLIQTSCPRRPIPTPRPPTGAPPSWNGTSSTPSPTGGVTTGPAVPARRSRGSYNHRPGR